VARWAVGSWPEKKIDQKKTKNEEKKRKVRVRKMDKTAEERFLAVQAEAAQQRLEMQKQMQAIQHAMQKQMEQQQLDFDKFQRHQASAAAAIAGAGAGGMGGRAGGVGGSGAGSEAGSAGTGEGGLKKKQRVSVGGKKAATAAEEDGAEGGQEERVACEYAGCPVTFRVCGTTAATKACHNKRCHPEEKQGIMLVLQLCLCLVCCVHCVLLALCCGVALTGCLVCRGGRPGAR
jgi:hypothetical protein